MANWWDSDPIADSQPKADEWWKSDPVAGTAPAGKRSYIGASAVAGGRSLLAAGARLIDELNPFTLSESDAATLFKNDPEKLKQFTEKSASMVLSRFANEQTRLARETMKQADPAETGAISGQPVSKLEYATLDPEKAAYLSPTRVAGDVLNSLPTTLALGVTAYLTKGASTRAAAQAEAAAAARGATQAEAAAAARAAAIESGANTMAKVGATSEGAAGYAMQRNQTFDEAFSTPEDKLAESPQYQQLLAQGYSPQAARLKLSADVAQESGLLAGAVDAGTNLVGGRILGRVIGEGGKLLPRVAKGFATEAATETVQSAGEQLGENVAMRAIDPTLDLGKGVGEAAAAGLVVGGVTGGGVSALFGSGGNRSEDQSPRRKLAEDQLRNAPDAGSAAAAANDLAGSVDELTSNIDSYLRQPGTGALTLSAAAPTAGIEPLTLSAAPAADTSPLTLAQQRQRVDREAELLGEADAAGTAFDRRMALEQIAAARPDLEPGAAAGFVDLTPMNERQAQARLTVLRDETANAGGNALELAIVPHPAQANAFAIGRQQLPSLDLDTTPAAVSPVEAQSRIESAAMVGEQAQRRAEDAPRLSMVNRALTNIKARGGVASPFEAEVLRQANAGQPYDRIDPTLGRAASTDETLTAATGIAVGQEASVGFGARQTQRQGALEQANAESMAEMQARAASRRAEAERTTQEQIAAANQQPAAPPINDVIQALVVPGRDRTAEQQLTIRQAEQRMDPADFSIAQRAATAPFQLSTEERLRLREMRAGAAAPAATAIKTSAPTPRPLMGSRVAERLGLPSGGRIITSSAKLSTQRNVAPGATVAVKDRDTDHSVNVVDVGRLGVSGRLLQQIARIFGKRLVAFESDTLLADGFVLDDDNRSIFINAKSQISPLAVFGHELTHLLKRDNPRAYAALQAVVERELGEGAMQRFEQEYGSGANLEELTSDLVGNRFQEASFWTDVFNEVAAQNPEGARGVITRMAAAISKAVNAFLKVVRQPGFQADTYVKDVQAVKAAVRQALADYAQQQREPAMALEAEQARAESRVDLGATARPEPAARQPFQYDREMQGNQREMGVPLVGTGERAVSDVEPTPFNKPQPTPQPQRRPIEIPVEPTADERRIADGERRARERMTASLSRRRADFTNPEDRLEVSTTRPVPAPKKGRTGTSYDEKWVIDGQDVRSSQKHVDAVMRALRQYNTLSGKGNAKKLMQELHDVVVENLLWLHDLVPANVRERAKLWYDGANRIANDWTGKYGISLRQASGVLAVLSPQMDWFKNVSLGERVITIWKNRQNEAWSPAMTAWLESWVNASKDVDTKASRRAILEEARPLQGVTLAEMNDRQAALYIRVFDEAYHERQYRLVTPEGGFGGYVTNSDDGDASVTWGGFDTIEKAVSILNDGAFRNIDQKLGDEHKVRNFYNNIINPGSADGHVTIDTHAVAAALVKALSGSSREVADNFGSAGQNAETGASGTYGLFADAYRDAAAQRGILPREMQSITWEAVRALFPASIKDQLAPQVDAVWNRFRKGEITRNQAREEVRKLAGGIRSMAWEGTDAGAFAADGGVSFNAGIPENVDERQARTLPPEIAKDKIQVNLSANTSTIPGVAALQAAAASGDMLAHRLLQDIALDNLRHLLAGTSARVKADGVTGLYGGYVESGLSMSVSFADDDRPAVLAALAKFADNFNQEQVHVRRGVKAKAGTAFDDGSYATPVYRWELKKGLTRKQIEKVIVESGLYGLTFADDFVEAYYVGEPSDGTARQQFDQAIDRAGRLLGRAAESVGRTVERLWAYGDSARGLGFAGLRGDVPAGTGISSETAKRVAGYLNQVAGKDGKPALGKVKTFDQPAEITPQQDALQTRIAQAYDVLPENDLKNPNVRKAYAELSKEVLRQFRAMPIKLEVYTGTGEPYANSAAMRRDVLDNNHLFIYGTRPETFGPEGQDFSAHPLLADSGERDVNGYKLVFNDLLRGVHDYYAHSMSPAQFGPKGEEAAWKNHMSMTPSMWARWALTMETRAQNSWVNFREGLDRSTPISQRSFAPQKAALLPVEFTLTGDRTVDKPMKEFIAKLGDKVRQGSKPAPVAKPAQAKLSRQRQTVERNADAIAAMDPDVRDNTELGDFPGGPDAYNLYEARTLLKKPSNKLKRVTESNSFSLWQNYDFIANVDGELFGVTKQEDPDELDDETKFIYAFENLADGTSKETVTDQQDELFREMRASMAGPATLSRPRLTEDIPNEDWLQGKIDYAQKKGRNQYGVPHMSTVTGYFNKPVEVSLRVLSKLKGERDEQNNVREESLKYIRKNWDKVSQEPPYIEVAYNGEAWVSEGNHRIMVAAEKGLESMPVEIRYFDGGQRRNGPLNPSRIPSLENPDITASRQRQINTPEFKRWFGDSKVVDENGEPLVVYHATTADFDTFDTTRRAIAGEGSWFSESPMNSFANEEGGNIMPVYLSLQNPKVIDLTRESDDVLKKKFIEQGYDGVVMKLDGRIVTAVAFYPEQIKSATGNRGTFDPNNPDITASRQRTPLGFYSALAEGVDGIKTNAAPAAGWRDAIKGLVNKGQVKADEVEWSGINDWLALQQGKVTREQVAEYLRQGGVQVEETVLGRDALSREEQIELTKLRRQWDASADMSDAKFERMQELERRVADAEERPAKYDSYTLPGGENYREVLLTLPKGKVPSYDEVTEFAKRWVQEEFDRKGTRFADSQEFVDAMKDDIWAWNDLWSESAIKHFGLAKGSVLRAYGYGPSRTVDAEPADTYKSSHWDQPNVLAHIRVNDRTDADGNKVLFVEEIQSDWGQEGKKKGFASEADWEVRDRGNGTFAVYQKSTGERVEFRDGTVAFTTREAAEAAIKEKNPNSAYGAKSGVPTAPFVTKTEGWLNLALKRVMTMAVEGGYDKVAFVNGEQSAERYDLSKQVDELHWRTSNGSRRATLDMKSGDSLTFNLDESGVVKSVEGTGETRYVGKGFDEIVGKELAEKVLSEPGGVLSGNGLKVGGEGMKTFYDTIVPNAVRALAKKLGGRVETVEVPTFDLTEANRMLQSGEISSYSEMSDYQTGGQPGLVITDAMREKVGEGLPLFSPRRNIFGQQVLSNWSNLPESKMDDFLYTMQDKMVDTKRVVEAIKQAAGNIDDKWNAYLQEELYHGRTAKQTKDFLTDELRPLLEDMQSRGVTMEVLEEYLHNRHAEERNIQIAKVNPNMPDGGSGIDTADARAYLAAIDPAQRRNLEALAKRVDAITATTRQLLVSSGLETQDTVDAWERTYGSYVPLFREDTDFAAGGGAGTGQGYSVRGPASRRATGSSRPVVDILANLAMQRERTIVRAEKMRVGQAIYGMAVQNPNTNFWLAVDPEGQKDPNKAIADLVSMGMNPIDARNIVEEPVQQTIDPRTGLVVQRVNPLLRNSDNVLAVRADGRERYVFFNANDERAQRMVSALKNLDADQLGRVMGMMATVTRYFASVNTQYNPIFGVVNLTRDTFGAAFNLTTTPISDRKRQVMADIMPALRGIYSDLRSQRAGKGPATGTWATLWGEFQNEGGQTGFRDMFSKSAERASALEKELKRINEGKAKQFGRAMFDWLSDYNETLENAVRLSAYKAAKDKGMSTQQAASVAKNLTVNFNRKGQVGVQAGALYAFFNASVQGTARLAETLRGPAGKKIVAGGLLLGTAQALLLAAAGFDEDEPPEFVKERNLVIPTGDGKYITVPMPLGLNVIPNTSRVLTEFALSGWRDPSKRIGQITGAFLEMFNPIGNAGWSVQTLAPTIADPLVALAENRDWTGKPIAKKDRSDIAPTPGYTRAKETASWFSKELSYYLNLASGGTKYKPGLISPTPDQIDYLIGQATGGVGREALKVEQSITSQFTGEELPTYKMPLVGRFYGNAKSPAAESNRFYENLKRINEHEAEIKGRQKNREGGVLEYRRDNPEARLISIANQAEKDVQELRARRRQLVEKGAAKESVQIQEQRIATRMKRFNDRVREVREQATQ